MILRALAVLAAALSPSLGAVPSANADSARDTANIRQLMRGTRDRPDAPLAIDPILVVGEYALAGWVQGDVGGRALLPRKNGAWSTAVRSGDARAGNGEPIAALDRRLAALPLLLPPPITAAVSGTSA